MEHAQALHAEPQAASATTINWLRAAVLGANDGIVSVAAIVVGVAGATSDTKSILIAGVAGLLAGAFSMAAGEYVSVSSQRDTEHALMEKERRELEEMPEQELQELAKIYEGKGLSPETAMVVAKELTAHDAFAAHLEAELRIDPEGIANPWHAAYASWLSFFAGAVLPLLAITLPPVGWRIPATFLSVIVALALTGALSASAGGANKSVATMRVIAGGLFAMIVTYGIGTLLGTVGI